MPCLNYYKDLFYKDGKKIIPANISELLTARALAYWICADGNLGSHGETNLYCMTYSLEEIELLRKALIKNFKLIYKTNIKYKKIVPAVPEFATVTLSRYVPARM